MTVNPHHLGIPFPVVRLVNMAVNREVARVLGVGHLAGNMRSQVVWSLGLDKLTEAVELTMAREDVRNTIRMLCACPLPGTETYKEHGAEQVEEHFEAMVVAFKVQLTHTAWAAAMEQSLLVIYNDQEPSAAAHRHGEVAQWLTKMEQDGPLEPPLESFTPCV